MAAWWNIFGQATEALSGAYKANVQRKSDKEAGHRAVESQIIAGEQNVSMSIQQWQAMSLKGNEDSWKDELITVVFLSPIATIMFGSVYGAITGDMNIVNGMKEAIAVLNGIGGQFGDMMVAVVYAGIGIQATTKVAKKIAR